MNEKNLKSPESIRANYLLSTLTQNPSQSSNHVEHHATYLFIVGEFDLAHRNYIESYANNNHVNVNSYRDCSDFLQYLHLNPNKPYLAGVILCWVSNDHDLIDCQSLVKFLKTAHPMAIIGTVFFGTLTNVDHILFLNENSLGYKNVIPSTQTGVNKFLENALNKSIECRSRMLADLLLLSKLSTLSAKEIHVMLEVISGLTNKEISEQLSNSQRTVEIHRANIFQKMTVKNAIDLSRLIYGAVRN